MTKIRVNINDLFCDLHCPGCGGSDWFKPKTLLEGWYRCKICGTDIKYLNVAGLKLYAVVEPVDNKTYDKFKKATP
jgi:uncharacterized protein (DUF983 family)